MNIIEICCNWMKDRLHLTSLQMGIKEPMAVLLGSKINMNRFISITFLLWLVLNITGAQDRPNIIWLMAEDIGPDLECYGMPGIKTPHLNRLAEGGIKYTNCYCTNPICSPNRSAMMVGVHQSRINAQHHRSNASVPLPDPFRPFTSLLREQGYTTILGSSLVMDRGRKTDCNFKHTPVGKWDGIEKFGLFDKYDEYEIEDQPFFAQIQLKVTHRGDWWDEIRNQSEKPVDPDSVVLPPFMADEAVIRLDWARYMDQIEYMDHEVGLIVKDLKEKGMYENTVIIFIGDNGRCNIRGKGYLTDPGIHIPLILHWPDSVKPGQVNNDLISTIDITATILDIAGINLPSCMDGRPFLGKSTGREYVFSARDLWDEIPDRSRSITTPVYKYIRNDFPGIPYDAHQAYLEFYRPAVHSMRKLKLAGKLDEEMKMFFQAAKPIEELYDLRSDPFELNNLATDTAYLNILVSMREILEKEEEFNKAPQEIFYPITPLSVAILEFVKYYYPSEYLRLLDGVEIGFQKYAKLYNEFIKTQHL